MRSIILVLAAASLALATVHHRGPLPPGWSFSKLDLLTTTPSPLTITLALTEDPAGMAQVKQHALKASDPSSPMYGEYLSSEQISSLVAPSPEAIQEISAWLRQSLPTGAFKIRGSRATITCTISEAESLFNTKFITLTNRDFHQVVHRAGAYQVPDHLEKHVAAIFGLHGLPLPPRADTPSGPADVTPDVLTKFYSVSGVTPKPDTKNSQAVAEFQGQYMNNSDLTAFFKQYIANYKAGVDDTVSKFVGDTDKQMGQTEASLDIQYMKGVAPQLKTEFWLFNSMDFCGDLANWTGLILSTPDAPLVHSVSYGWQGDLSQLHCTDDKVKVVDDNFAKLAANGISIIFASGDSGSGYNPRPDPTACEQPSTKDTVHEGKSSTMEAYSESQCCMDAIQLSKAGWSFTPGDSSNSQCGDSHTGVAFTGTARHLRNVDLDTCCRIASEEHSKWTYIAGDNSSCNLFFSVTSNSSTPGATSGAPPPPGHCQLFDTITGKKTQSGTSSGVAPSTSVKLWPSWPASSPWVTSVGGTRFVGQKVGNPEMATDQFGSGGGFSSMFNITDNAKWQADDVASYLKVAPQLPPKGSYPPGGRATPDVSALGEGYQVLQNGRTSPVGGTSASTPVFAGLVGLLNEARIQAGKKPMGFLNPWIYQNKDAFTDVLQGDNAYGRGPFRTPYGFNVTKGWDPVTGVGSPIFTKMLAAATKN